MLATMQLPRLLYVTPCSNANVYGRIIVAVGLHGRMRSFCDVTGTSQNLGAGLDEACIVFNVMCDHVFNSTFDPNMGDNQHTARPVTLSMNLCTDVLGKLVLFISFRLICIPR